jgi:hypothetical protein
MYSVCVLNDKPPKAILVKSVHFVNSPMMMDIKPKKKESK